MSNYRIKAFSDIDNVRITIEMNNWLEKSEQKNIRVVRVTHTNRIDKFSSITNPIVMPCIIVEYKLPKEIVPKRK